MNICGSPNISAHTTTFAFTVLPHCKFYVEKYYLTFNSSYAPPSRKGFSNCFPVQRIFSLNDSVFHRPLALWLLIFVPYFLNRSLRQYEKPLFVVSANWLSIWYFQNWEISRQVPVPIFCWKIRRSGLHSFKARVGRLQPITHHLFL